MRAAPLVAAVMAALAVPVTNRMNHVIGHRWRRTFETAPVKPVQKWRRTWPGALSADQRRRLKCGK